MSFSIEDITYFDGGVASVDETAGELFHLPYADLHYAVGRSDGICARMIRDLNIERLRRVSQFGFTTPPINPALRPRQIRPYTHNRFQHVCDVTAVALRIAKQSGLWAGQIRRMAAASLTHDILTPAGGDCTKEVHPVAFDEDANYPRLFDRPAWAHVRDAYDLDEQLLAGIVRNEGTLGTLLDWADKIAYMARDLDEFLLRRSAEPGEPYLYRQGEHAWNDAIDEILARRPHPMSFWRDVRVINGQVVCTDVDALADFLHLRIIFFRHLHYSEYTRFLRVFVDTAIKVLLFEKRLTHEKLIEMDDGQLSALIEERTGVSTEMFCGDRMGEPFVSLCDGGVAEAHSEMRRQQQRGSLMMFFVNRGPLLKVRADLLVRFKGKVMPFSEACPTMAGVLKKLTWVSPTVLFWLKTPPTLKPDYVEGLKAYWRSVQL